MSAATLSLSLTHTAHCSHGGGGGDCGGGGGGCCGGGCGDCGDAGTSNCS